MSLEFRLLSFRKNVYDGHEVCAPVTSDVNQRENFVSRAFVQRLAGEIPRPRRSFPRRASTLSQKRQTESLAFRVQRIRNRRNERINFGTLLLIR